MLNFLAKEIQCTLTMLAQPAAGVSQAAHDAEQPEVLVQITCTREGVSRIRTNAELSGDQLGTVQVIQKTLEQLAIGNTIDRYFNPTAYLEESRRMLKCKWLKNGNLVIVEEDPARHYRHVTTTEEAIQQKRTFTCTRSLHAALPRKRRKG